MTVGCTVTGIDIEMQGAETNGTVIPRSIFQRRNLVAAVFADKRIIVFRESFRFHSIKIGTWGYSHWREADRNIVQLKLYG